MVILFGDVEVVGHLVTRGGDQGLLYGGADLVEYFQNKKL